MKDADNLPIDRWPQLGQAGDDLCDGEGLLQWVQTLQMLPHKLFVHHGNAHAGCAVLVGERAPAHNMDAKGFEVVRADRLEGGSGPLGLVNQPSPGNGKWHSVAGAEQRRASDCSRCRDSGNGLDTVENLPVMSVNLR